MNSTVPEIRQKRPNWRTGAPDGNSNALKHGRYTKEARALRARIRDFKRRAKIALARVDREVCSSHQRGEIAANANRATEMRNMHSSVIKR